MLPEEEFDGWYTDDKMLRSPAGISAPPPKGAEESF